MIHLYEHPLSPYAQKVKIALYEKSIPFESSIPNLFGETERDFLVASPRREVPSLVDGEAMIFDSTIILEYLEEKWPQPALLPAAPAARARLRMIEELCDTYYEAINWAVAEIRVFERATLDLAEQLLRRAEEQIAGVHAWLTRHLGTAPYFNGAQFGWGDLSVYPYVAGSAVSGLPPPAGAPLAAWFERVNERDSIRKCAAAAAEAFGGFQNLGALVQSGAFVREYRDHRLEWMVRSGGIDIVLDGLQKKNIRFAVELE